MIQKMVRFVLRMPAFVVILAGAIVALGLYCYSQLDIEAYPNPVPPMIEIITQPTGWSAEEVERYVTVPLENGLTGMLGLDHIRSQSLFGLSDVKCYFSWDTDYDDGAAGGAQPAAVRHPAARHAAAALAVERHRRDLPLRRAGTGYTLAELKTAEDWILEKKFSQVPGVIDVVGFGGETKQYHVEVDPYRLKGARPDARPARSSALPTRTRTSAASDSRSASSPSTCAASASSRSLQDIGDVVADRAEGRCRSACATWPT